MQLAGYVRLQTHWKFDGFEVARLCLLNILSMS